MEQFEDKFPPYYFWRDGGGEFQDYYDGRYVTSGFYPPLYNSLALTNGTGSPTLTRATAMWEFDNEGKLITVQASAAAFGGARRVRNLCSAKSDDFSHSSYSKVGASTPSANVLLSAALTTPQYLLNNLSATVSVGQWYVGTFRVQYVDIRYVQLAGTGTTFSSAQYANFDLVDGDYTAVGCAATITPVSSGVWDISVLMQATGTTSPTAIVLALVDSQSATRLQAFTGDGVKSLIPLRYQLENVTGQSDQTASEYVSVGVLSAPYHGAGLDGVKWFNTHKDGTPIPPSNLIGLATNDTAVTNTMLYCRDFTNAAWVKTNVTAAQTQTGLDNVSNSCSLLTATANDATILQTITAAAAAGCTGWYVTRSIGSGTISITRDNTNWTDITSLINSATATKVKIENTSVLNPVVGFKFGTSGDAIIVDGGLNHLGTKLYHLPILTTSAAVTVQSQTLTYPKTSNIIDANGTIMATCTADDWAGIDGSIVGSTTRGLFATATGASAKDGTNTPTGASDTPSGTVKIGMKYTTDFMRTMSDAGFGTATDYTGTLATDLTNISIGAGFTGHIKEVAIWQEVISDYKMRNMP